MVQRSPGRFAGRWLTSVVAVSSLLAVAAPADAAARQVATRVVAHVTPATVHVGSLVVVSGTVSPRGGTVVVQRLVGRSWHPVGKAKLAAGGTYTLSLRAPNAAASWVLRVTRTVSKTAKAGVSAALHVRVVKAIYVVAATTAPTVTTPAAIVVTGKVSPKATGTVWLQALSGKTWQNVASAKLTATSTYSVHAPRPVGTYRLRVVKAFSTNVAGGISSSLSVNVTAASGPPSVTTSSLPDATVGKPYTATLSATGGTPPYVWTSAGLAVGLTLSAAGVLSGTPTTTGTSMISVAATDATARTGTASLALTVAAAPRPAGRLWAWGSNNYGELGNNTTVGSNAIVPVSGMTSVLQVSATGNDGLALQPDGTVWAWGNNAQGQLGNATLTYSSVPVQVNGLTSVSAVAGGGATGYALRSDGTVWAWGYNGIGELGNNSTTNSSLPVQVVGLTSITAIAGGAFWAGALRSDGTVWTWGLNAEGQLGNNTTTNSLIPVQVTGLSSVTAIAAGGAAGYALRPDGYVWAWGRDVEGELGNNSTTNSGVPVQVSGLTSVTGIAAGNLSGYALRSDGTVWAWGSNTNGQLGDGSVVDKHVAVQVSGLTSVTAIAAGLSACYALRGAGYVSAWGEGAQGQLGNGTVTSSSVPVQVSGLTGVVGIGSEGQSASGYAIVAG